MNRFEILKGIEPPQLPEDDRNPSEMFSKKVYICPKPFSAFYEGLLLDSIINKDTGKRKVMIQVHENFSCDQIAVGSQTFILVEAEKYFFEEITWSLNNKNLEYNGGMIPIDKIIIIGTIRPWYNPL